MTSSKLLRVSALTAVLSMSAFSAAHADLDPQVDCYTQVHDSCFPSGSTPQCTNEEYNDALNLCDAYASEGQGDAARPTPPRQILGKTTKSDPLVVQRLKWQIKRQFGGLNRQKPSSWR